MRYLHEKGQIWDYIQERFRDRVLARIVFADRDQCRLRRLYEELPPEILRDLPQGPVQDPEWDGYERKVIRKIADSVKIGIKGGVVDAVVSKKYE